MMSESNDHLSVRYSASTNERRWAAFRFTGTALGGLGAFALTGLALFWRTATGFAQILVLETLLGAVIIMLLKFEWGLYRYRSSVVFLEADALTIPLLQGFFSVRQVKIRLKGLERAEWNEAVGVLELSLRDGHRMLHNRKTITVSARLFEDPHMFLKTLRERI